MNIGLKQIEKKTEDNFMSITGLKIRKKLNKPLKYVLKKATKAKIVLESYPDLEKNKPYIFASTHYHSEDIISNLAILDRNSYALIGTTDQLEHNPQMYAAWLNGIVYVDRLNNESRKESLKKMKKLLENNTSVLIFPEGGWNNTENLLCQKLFAGPYILSNELNVPVVPISNFLEQVSNTIYINVGNPLDLSNKDKKESLILLRDTISTMMFNQIKKYSVPIKRNELDDNLHYDFMEERKKEYLKVKWTKDVWDEELTVYKDKEITYSEDVRKSFDNVKITKDNANIFAPILVRRLEDENYNFKKFMKNNWNK